MKYIKSVTVKAYVQTSHYLSCVSIHKQSEVTTAEYIS